MLKLKAGTMMRMKTADIKAVSRATVKGVVLVSSVFFLSGCLFAPVQLNIIVHDDEERPVAGAKVSGSFFQDRVVSKISTPHHAGETDAKGFVRLSGREDLYVDLSVSKAGYYDTIHRVLVRGGSNKRQVPVLLRKKRDPVAMYAKNATIELPGYGQEFGYDLFRGDLVMPEHKGVVADIVLRVDRPAPTQDEIEAKLTIRFSNPLDGQTPMVLKDAWRDSAYKTAYLAPMNGYLSSLHARIKRSASGYERENLQQPFFLRIRSQADSVGQLQGANYCKVAPGINILGYASPRPTIDLRHYCNAVANDRNVEFDVGHNLLVTLKSEDRVNYP